MESKRKGHGSGSGSSLWPPSWRGKVLLVTWIVLLGLWIQFSFASVEELEHQAVALGIIVVVILLLGGLTVWAARIQTRNR